MQRRRFLAGALSGAFAGLLSGCAAGKYARRIGVNGTIGSENSAVNTPNEWTERGLVLLKYDFYRRNGSAGVRGVVTNDADIDFDFVSTYVRFFDRSGTRIGHAYDAKSGLPVGEKWQFNAPLLEVDPKRVARYRLVVIDQRSTESEPFRNDTS